MARKPRGRPRRFAVPVTRSIVLEETEVEAVERIATEKGESFSAVVRRLVVSVLSPPPNEPTK